MKMIIKPKDEIKFKIIKFNWSETITELASDGNLSWLIDKGCMIPKP